MFGYAWAVEDCFSAPEWKCCKKFSTDKSFVISDVLFGHASEVGRRVGMVEVVGAVNFADEAGSARTTTRSVRSSRLDEQEDGTSQLSCQDKSSSHTAVDEAARMRQQGQSQNFDSRNRIIVGRK